MGLKFYKDLLKWGMKYPVPASKRLGIMLDYFQLYKSKGLTLDEYYEFEFEKRSTAFRNTFLGVREQRYYLEQLNPFKYFIFSRNKFAAHRFFENTAIRTSELYCYYDPLCEFSDSTQLASDVESVTKLLKQKEVKQCVIKATEDSHGDNVIVVKDIVYQEQDCELCFFNGEKKLLSEVLGKSPRIFESVINQTKQFASFNESSVNTVRFMTTLYPDGSARIIAAFIKIGRAGKCVDNAGSGGNVDVCVDVNTGKIMYPIRYDGWRKITDIQKHPDSGVQLDGVIIENWESIKEEVKKFQQCFPWCKAAGWDIAITEEGPMAIEVNDMWDRTGQYFIRRGWRPEIRDCYEAWMKAGYKAKRGRLENDFSLKQCKKLFK